MPQKNCEVKIKNEHEVRLILENKDFCRCSNLTILKTVSEIIIRQSIISDGILASILKIVPSVSLIQGKWCNTTSTSLSLKNSVLERIQFHGSELKEATINYLVQSIFLKEISIKNCVTLPKNVLQRFLSISTLEKLVVINSSLREILPQNVQATTLKLLDLSNNELYGDLEFLGASMHNLEALNLSFNQLSGTLDKITVQNTVKVVDVSHNKFVNSLPQDMSKLIHLEHLDVTHNFLFGKISLFLLDFLVTIDTIMIFEGNQLEIDFNDDNSIPPTASTDNVLFTLFPTQKPTQLTLLPRTTMEPTSAANNDFMSPDSVQINLLTIAFYFLIGSVIIGIIGTIVFFDSKLLFSFKVERAGSAVQSPNSINSFNISPK